MRLKYFFSIFLLFVLVSSPRMGLAQMQIAETLVLSNSSLKAGTNAEAVQSRLTELNKKSNNVSFNFFKADRGKGKGDMLITCSGDVKSKAGPFNELSDLLDDGSAFTEYKLIGAKQFPSLPKLGILGIHYIKIKQDRSKDFEKFVEEKLNPVLGKLLPDMQMLYYKGTAGQQIGSYITVFTIESIAARDKYWPLGSETEKLKETFRPLKELALELKVFLEEGSYLKPESGGAAAYYESLEWTDFILQQP